MGKDGETTDYHEMVYVAVGRNVEEGKSLLIWALNNFEGRNICLLHVYHPTNRVSISNWRPSMSKPKSHEIASQEFGRLKMQSVMSQYILFLSRMGIQSGKVLIEMNVVEEGIMQLIIQHRIRCLIMGAGDDAFCAKKLPETKSSKAMVVCQQAPPCCHLWFICRGSLIHTRPLESVSLSTSAATLSSPTNRTTFTDDPDRKIDLKGDSLECFEYTSRSTEEPVHTISPDSSTVFRTSEDGSHMLLNSMSPETSSHSSSDTSLGSGLREEETSELGDELDHFAINAGNAEHRPLEDPLRCWPVEEDAFEDAHRAEAAEKINIEGLSRNQEIEELLISQKKEMEAVKNQQNRTLEQIQLLKNQKPILESQLRECHYLEKELEEKIIQAVNLMIKFKETRDKLKIEYDSATREINKFKTLVVDDPKKISNTDFFGISFWDLIEATENFDPSYRIGEGRNGSVFKGMFSQVKVAIMMLPSSGSQSDSEFKYAVEVLSRVRHPNLATLIGVCPESRSLVYEYIENGSLEDYLSSSAKTRFLSWQIRIKVATDICSALRFLHGCTLVHGNLKNSNILLDTNCVCKISNFGIHNILISGNNDAFSSYTTESDIFSFGRILLCLLTGRPGKSVVRDVKCAMESGIFESFLDVSAGDWPVKQAEELADLALRCCEKDTRDLLLEMWGLLEPLREMCILSDSSSSLDSRNQQKIPSHFLCPIFQEVMKNPHIAADGFTYEGDAIKEWFNGGHKTSPMTNLKLENCDLFPNNALYLAIQAWKQQNT